MPGSEKSLENYQLEDFVTDESFINYHFHHNKEDKLFWEKWLTTHPQNRKLAEAAREMLQNLSLTLSNQEYKAELERMKKAINEKTPINRGYEPDIVRLLDWKKAPHSVKGRSKGTVKYFLAAMLVFALGGFFLLKHFATTSGQLVEKYNNSSKPFVLTLTDGTIVTLAAQCVFRYPSNFENRDRNVYLDGDAQFQVAKDQAHPFTVYSGDLIATALGTLFIIKKQPGDSVMLVELIKGKLKVQILNTSGKPMQSIILNPDERAVYARHGRKLYKEIWESQVNDSLLHNHFIFHKSNFDEIAKQLRVGYGITIINQSDKKKWRFTGEFKNNSAISVLESICIVEKLKYEFQGDTVFIR